MSKPKSKTVALVGAASMSFVAVGRLTAHHPLPSDHPFYAAVGRVASEWAHLEHLLDLVVWQLARVDPARGACITAQIMGVGGRCKAILALGGLHGLSETILKGFRKLMGDSYKVADLRARLVHDPWYIEKEVDQPGQFKSMAYSDQRYGIQDVTKEEIAATLVKITALKDRATVLRSNVFDALDTSRKKQP